MAVGIVTNEGQDSKEKFSLQEIELPQHST